MLLRIITFIIILLCVGGAADIELVLDSIAVRNAFSLFDKKDASNIDEIIPSKLVKNGQTSAATVERIDKALATFASAFPGAASNVAGVGMPGLDNPPGFFIYQHPTSNIESPALRVQRDVPAIGPSVSGKTYKAIWGVINTSPSQAGYEWSVTGEVHNKTLGTTGAQHVAVNGTIFKENNEVDQIGPSWGGNFACLDRSKQIDPIYSCVGAEINTVTTASGTDLNRQRVGLHISVGGTPPSLGAHIGYGLLIGSNAGDTIDRGIGLRTAYQIGLDTTGGTFSTSAVMIGEGQRIAMDGNDKGGYYRSLRYDKGNLIYSTQNGDSFKVGDAGNITAKSLSSPSGGSGVTTSLFSKPHPPSVGDIPLSHCADWYNTETSVLRRVCNIGGAIKTVKYH